MKKLNSIYEGKAKILYTTEDADLVIQYFKDDATAFNAKKKGSIDSKGIYNNKISTLIFEFLESKGIHTHFEKSLNDREMLIKRVEIVPIEVIIRNRAAGSLCRLLGLAEGQILSQSVLEFCYKRDDLGDPLINEDHIAILNLATPDELNIIKTDSYKINALMQSFFKEFHLELIDFKLEFGRFKNQIILADEMSPDTCRLWEIGSGRKMDKDRFRHDLGDISATYQEVLDRLTTSN